MKKKLLYIPFEGSYLPIESLLAPDALIKQVRSGEWQPPFPLPGAGPFAAGRVGEIVVVMPAALAHPDIDVQLPRLTPRQVQFARALAQGHTAAEIALQYGISLRQVRRVIRQIKERLGADSLPQALAAAAALGLVNLEDAE